jgi:Protein of unknown function (DUF3828)
MPIRFAPAIVLPVVMAVFGGSYVHAQSTPEQTVTAFYKWYVHELVAEKDPRNEKAKINAASSARLQRWFRSKQGREWDADYFIDAQDFDPKWETHISTSKAVIKGNTAELKITLGPVVKAVNSMSPHTLRIKMVKEGGVWKIDHVNGY